MMECDECGSAVEQSVEYLAEWSDYYGRTFCNEPRCAVCSESWTRWLVREEREFLEHMKGIK